MILVDVLAAAGDAAGRDGRVDPVCLRLQVGRVKTHSAAVKKSEN